MIEMPSDLDRPWEPWTFKVGDRVRILPHPECRAVAPKRTIGGQIGVPFHSEILIGEIGHVWKIDEHEDLAGHRYLVEFGRQITDPKIPYPFWLAFYAAIELELLEDERA